MTTHRLARRITPASSINLRVLAAATAVGVIALTSSTARAQTTFHWNAPTGNWNVGANWDLTTVPTNAGGTAFASVDNAGTATINSAVPTVAQVWVGNGPTNGSLAMTGGSLTVDSQDATQSGFLVVGRTVDVTGAHAGSSLSMTGGSIVADQIEVGQSFAGLDSTNAQMTVGGNSTVTIHNYLRVGHGDGGSDGAQGTLTVKDNGVFTHDGIGTRAFVDDFIAFGFNGSNGGNAGTLNLQDNAIFNSKRPVRFGWVEEGKGFLNVSGNAQLNIDSGEMSAAAIMFGDFNNGSNATPNNRPIGVATQTGGTVTVGTNTARPQWTAVGGSGRGEYNLSGGKLNLYIRDGLNIGDTDQNGWAGEGVFNMTGGTLNATEVWLGKIGRATGTFTQSGGSVNIGVSTADGNFVDRIDTNNQQLALGSGDGRLNIGGAGDGTTATGSYTLSGGTLHVLGANIGDRATGTFTQSGGTFTADQGVIVARDNNGPGGVGGAPSTGVYHLNGGLLTTLSLTGGAGTSTVNFNGGTLRASAANAAFIGALTTANLALGGAKIDSNGFNIGSAQILAGAGGLTKEGAGMLTLTGASTYAGDTRVDGGVLSISSAYLANGADVRISSAATLNLSFVGTDTIDSLILGSVVAGAGEWGSATSGAANQSPLLTGSGRLLVQSAPAYHPADFDKNGVVNGLDLAQWRGDFGLNSDSDANADGRTDGNDFLIWQRNLGRVGPAVAAAGAVPEPSGVALVLVCGAALAARRSRRQPLN